MAQTQFIKASKTALLVIDVQRALFTRPTPVYNAHPVVETIKSLVDRANLYGVEVVYIQHNNKSILQKGTDGWKLHPGLKPLHNDHIVQKQHGNAFIDTLLPGILEARNIENLLITGLVSQGCVRATSLGGVELGYQVYLIRGGHSNYNKDAPQVIEKVEQELEEAGVRLVSPEEFDFQ
jgi:nicotinamidase-related amidase